MPQISIVVPIYRTGAILRDGLTDLKNQTFQDIEIICVDDGSNDRETLCALKEFEADSHFKMIYFPENKGAAEARNAGLEAASGQFVIFLDADDRFMPDFLENMFNTIDQADADISICGYTIFDMNTGMDIGRFCLRKKKSVTSRPFNISELGEDALLYWNMAPFNKLIRRSFIEENSLQFQTLRNCNDVYFVAKGMMVAKRIVYCNDGIELLRYRTNVEGQISSKRDPFNLWKAFEKLYGELSLDDLSKRQLFSFLMNASTYELGKCKDDNLNKSFYEFISAKLKEISQEIHFETKTENAKLERFVLQPYESSWFDGGEVYTEGLNRNREIIMNLIKGRPVIVWGSGVKGRIIENFLFREQIADVKTTDSNDEVISARSTGGFKMIYPNEALNSKALILASNHAIFDYLSEKLEEADLIDMDAYM